VTVDGARGVGKVRRSHALANPTHSLAGRWWAARTVSTSPAEASTQPTTPARAPQQPALVRPLHVRNSSSTMSGSAARVQFVMKLIESITQCLRQMN
jgi:hypothetical protein